ncbi:hypothetical protein GGS23DRAFT_553869 [Durotheca rogersii]|uniref:uncharacterized protein n=1 Tax=Durotheca rogersii TaxID=419775 RepID=UPI0022207E0A|nr:uncharacterized protein GGS23DRAFT_553869 [Durotheca rogersii]KAI5865708.1 hypothetical protein GGS23DRAFT_553869 [Durotheca rogersii]
MSPSSFIHYSPQELLRLRAGVGTVHTVFLARELWEPHKRVNWRGLCAEPIVACWLAAREREVNYSLNGYTEERNCWVIVLELAARRSATVELRQADTAGNTITVCRPGPVPNVTSRVSRKGSPIDLLEGYACSFRLGLVVRRTVGDWLDTLQRSGLTGYALECGRGRYHLTLPLRLAALLTYWVSCPLRPEILGTRGGPPIQGRHLGKGPQPRAVRDGTCLGARRRSRPPEGKWQRHKRYRLRRLPTRPIYPLQGAYEA